MINGDGLPHQICTQCLQNVNRAYSFKQLCEKSDTTLRQYVNTLQPIDTTSTIQNIINDVKSDIFNSTEVLQQSSIFQDIFNDATTHSLVENFTNQNANTVVSDLAETMQSLQTIAEQCLPDTWDTDAQLVSCSNNSEETHLNAFSLTQDLYTIPQQENKYFCTICTKIFNTNVDLDKHLIEHQLEKSIDQFESKKYKKFFCNVYKKNWK